MALYSHGHYIEIDWDNYDPEFELIMGWVTPEEAEAALREYGRYSPGCDLKHGYGRWNVAGNWSDYDVMFEICPDRGRGQFEVTYVTWPDEK